MTDKVTNRADNLTNLPDNKDKPFGGVYSVYDDDTVATRNKAVMELSEMGKFYEGNEIREKYLNTFKEWAFSTHPNIKGVDQFDALCMSNGTSDSFAMFYLRYRENKRLRLRRGEYFYSQMMARLYFKDRFAWLDEDDIRPGDVILISCPFSDTGGNHPEYLEKLLTDCDRNDVPVMLDLAFINIAVDFEIDLTHPCIEYVVTSLSKVFPVEHFRIGMRMQKKMYTDQLYVVNENNYNYVNLASAHVGTKLMQTHPADFIYNKYKDKQIEMCEKYDVEVSPCVYFGIDHKNQYPVYNRGNKTNRLNFSKVWDGRMQDPKN